VFVPATLVPATLVFTLVPLLLWPFKIAKISATFFSILPVDAAASAFGCWELTPSAFSPEPSVFSFGLPLFFCKTGSTILPTENIPYFL
jgi:hypothetical protein